MFAFLLRSFDLIGRDTNGQSAAGEDSPLAAEEQRASATKIASLPKERSARHCSCSTLRDPPFPPRDNLQLCPVEDTAKCMPDFAMVELLDLGEQIPCEVDTTLPKSPSEICLWLRSALRQAPVCRIAVAADRTCSLAPPLKTEGRMTRTFALALLLLVLPPPRCSPPDGVKPMGGRQDFVILFPTGEPNPRPSDPIK